MAKGFKDSRERISDLLRSEAGIVKARRAMIRAFLPPSSLEFLNTVEYQNLSAVLKADIANESFIEAAILGRAVGPVAAAPTASTSFATATSDANNMAAFVIDKSVDPTEGMAPLTESLARKRARRGKGPAQKSKSTEWLG
jgi:hypothetical protein